MQFDSERKKESGLGLCGHYLQKFPRNYVFNLKCLCTFLEIAIFCSIKFSALSVLWTIILSFERQ